MDRNRLLLIVGSVVAVLLLGAVLFWSSTNKPEPEKTPDPTVTIDPGGTLSPTATPTPTLVPDPTATMPGTGGEHEGEHPHNHEGAFPSCEEDPFCDPTKEAVDNAADLPAALSVQPKVSDFTKVWLTIPSGETAEARAARISAAGGAAVASQPTRVSRFDTATTGVSAESTPQSTMMVLFLQREDGLLKFRVNANVEAFYTYSSGARDHHTLNGTVTLWVNDAGEVQRVSEDFPVLDELP